MREETRKIYIAEDGKEFTHKRECMKYEAEQAAYLEIRAFLPKISEFCTVRECGSCPFAYDEDMGCLFLRRPDQWEL